MARQKAQTPSLCYHLSGQSVVRIDGKDFYLGKHNSPQALARYAALVATYQANRMSLPDGFELSHIDDRVQAILGPLGVMPTHQANAPMTVRHVCLAYAQHCEGYYHNDLPALGKAKAICDEVTEFAGDMLASEFGPLELDELRESWITPKRSRRYINSLTNLVIRMFRWSLSRKMIPAETLVALKALEPLRKGRTKARENAPVQAVDISHVRATYEHLSPVLKAMLRIQVATGMRPTELCIMRPCDIDRSGPEWLYTPSEHKCTNKDKDRVIPILGDAREALEDYLNRPAGSYCFSPKEATAWHNAKKRSERKSKVQPSQQDRSKDNPEVSPRDRYDKDSYRRALQRAAKKAGVPQWTPYEVRHLVGTVVAEALQLENAKALLGHSDLHTTQRYSKATTRQAIAAARVAPKL